MKKTLLGLIVFASLSISNICAYAQAPTISLLTPTSGSVGTLITLNGTNLGNPTAFTVGGTTAIVVSNTGSTLVGLVMPGSTTGIVSVSTINGTASTASNFTVTTTPYPSLQQGNKLVGTGAAGNAEQGWSVALSADGNTAIVGGDGDQNGIGAAWVYVSPGSVGIDNVGGINTEIKIFPNPCSDKVMIEINNLQEHTVLYLYNAFGQVIQSVELNKNETMIQRGGLPNGVYLYRIVNTGRQISSGKLVFIDGI